MLTLRIVLVSICIVCLSWITLLSVGPLVLSNLIKSYSNGKLVASNITITPGLDIKIGRLEYAPSVLNNALNNKALFRSVEFMWSMSNNKPFLEVKSSSSLINKTFKTDNFKLYTPAFADLNFEKIFLTVEINNPIVDGVANSRAVNLDGFYEKDLNLFSDISFDISSVEVEDFEHWFVNSVSGVADKISLNIPIERQAISIEAMSSEVFNRDHNIFISSLNGDVVFEDREVDFFVSLSDVKLGNKNFIAKEVISQGTFLRERLFKNVNIEFETISVNGGATRFPSASIILSNPSANKLNIGVSGFSDKFDLNSSGNFIGKIPESTFELDFSLDGSEPYLNSNLNISLNFSEHLKIEGNGDLLLTFDDTTKSYYCIISNCQARSVLVDYKLFLNDEWVSGNASCALPPCLVGSIPHNLITSNTTKIFKTLSKAEIFNPMYLSYLYAFILSGEKFDTGHKIKIN